MMETLKKVESPICSVDIPSGKHNKGISGYYQFSFEKLYLRNEFDFKSAQGRCSNFRCVFSDC